MSGVCVCGLLCCMYCNVILGGNKSVRRLKMHTYYMVSSPSSLSDTVFCEYLTIIIIYSIININKTLILRLKNVNIYIHNANLWHRVHLRKAHNTTCNTSLYRQLLKTEKAATTTTASSSDVCVCVCLILHIQYKVHHHHKHKLWA